GHRHAVPPQNAVERTACLRRPSPEFPSAAPVSEESESPLLQGVSSNFTLLIMPENSNTPWSLYAGSTGVIESRPTSNGSRPCRTRVRLSFPSPAGLPLTDNLTVPPPVFDPSGVNSALSCTFPVGTSTVPAMPASAI